MQIFNLFYQKVDNEYTDEYYDATGLYFLGAFSSKEKAMEAVHADVKTGVKGEKAALETRDNVPSADEGMVRVVDGIPHGYYYFLTRELDKPTFDEVGENDGW